jgi:2-C-methyl-D-erythritol 2,4-cyclodiphosphate synthase
MLKIGYGIDTHAFVSGDGFFLCGIKIIAKQQVVAHSDGDVAIHSLIDAILGATGSGDIGEYFPDTDKEFKNANSCELLSIVQQNFLHNKFNINNIDMTIITQNPKISPYKKQMQEKIAKILKIKPTLINIKAKTSEKIGFIGKGEGISAHCVILIKEITC